VGVLVSFNDSIANSLGNFGLSYGQDNTGDMFRPNFVW
jgi:hypothetical protein